MISIVCLFLKKRQKTKRKRKQRDEKPEKREGCSENFKQEFQSTSCLIKIWFQFNRC